MDDQAVKGGKVIDPAHEVVSAAARLWHSPEASGAGTH
jgi:hypothetical protein